MHAQSLLDRKSKQYTFSIKKTDFSSNQGKVGFLNIIFS